MESRISTIGTAQPVRDRIWRVVLTDKPDAPGAAVMAKVYVAAQNVNEAMASASQYMEDLDGAHWFLVRTEETTAIEALADLTHAYIVALDDGDYYEDLTDA